MLDVFIISILFLLATFFIPEMLMRLFTNDTILIDYGIKYLKVIGLSYIFSGVLQVLQGILKNCGYAGRCTIISAVVVCVNIILNVILNVILIYGYDDAYAMIDALSRFYKINLSKGDDFITIEKNLVMLKSYIDIQQMRFGGEFEYIYSVDPEIMQWKILKFALQPLVENAINHGIHGFTTEGIINLDIVRTGEKSLKITLMDNGRGMSKEALKKAISGEEGRNGKSFGLFATLHRLQYCYGDRIWWSIESEENGGTTIIMKIEVEEC